MNITKACLFISVFVLFTFSRYNNLKASICEIVSFDTIPSTTANPYFEQAYDEISRMLDGKDSLSIKKNRLVLKKNALKNDDL